MLVTCGEGGIRTLGEFPHTVFPGLPIKPLLYLSMNSISRFRSNRIGEESTLMFPTVFLSYLKGQSPSFYLSYT